MSTVGGQAAAMARKLTIRNPSPASNLEPYVASSRAYDAL
jgi:hypothetical protein